MSKLQTFVAALYTMALATLMAPSPSLATVLTFDDLAPLSTSVDSPVPNGYGGLNWSNVSYLRSSIYGGGDTGYKGGTVSGEYVAFNSFTSFATISGAVFNVDSAYLAAAWNNGLTVTVQGFLSNVLLFSQTVSNLNYSQTPGATATLVNLNFAGIDKLTFSSFGGTDASAQDVGSGTHFVMDNIAFTLVPEPGTFALVGLGLAGLGWIRRRTP